MPSSDTMRELRSKRVHGDILETNEIVFSDNTIDGAPPTGVTTNERCQKYDKKND